MTLLEHPVFSTEGLYVLLSQSDLKLKLGAEKSNPFVFQLQAMDQICHTFKTPEVLLLPFLYDK